MIHLFIPKILVNKVLPWYQALRKVKEKGLFTEITVVGKQQIRQKTGKQMNKVISVGMKKTEETNLIQNEGVTLEREVRDSFYKKVTFDPKHPKDKHLLSGSPSSSPPPPPSSFCLFSASSGPLIDEEGTVQAPIRKHSKGSWGGVLLEKGDKQKGKGHQ